jgi:hypothetical protein
VVTEGKVTTEGRDPKTQILLEDLVKASKHFVSTYESGYLGRHLSDSWAFIQLKSCVKALSQE